MSGQKSHGKHRVWKVKDALWRTHACNISLSKEIECASGWSLRAIRTSFHTKHLVKRQMLPSKYAAAPFLNLTKQKNILSWSRSENREEVKNFCNSHNKFMKQSQRINAIEEWNTYFSHDIRLLTYANPLVRSTIKVPYGAHSCPNT